MGQRAQQTRKKTYNCTTSYLMLSKLSSLMLVSLTCGSPPHFTFNRLPLSLTLRHTHFSGQSLWLLSIVSAHEKRTLAQQTNNKMSKQLLGIMSCCTSVPEARSAYTFGVPFLCGVVAAAALNFDTTTTKPKSHHLFLVFIVSCCQYTTHEERKEINANRALAQTKTKKNN